ncbi:MAG: hypothetical protein GF346_13105 [Candidatus Eisenbacteria bacterium]|nr:hypothetical protein [Candidatus Latescibacterota bacterium]MBD3303377.1 hypothetical protein [Candidatus Eisenbacteria bacterium]
MLEPIAFGASLAFAAAVQPGPLQAYLFSRVVSLGWRRTLPASFSPLLSDGPIALLALLVLGRLSPTTQSVLRGAGGLLLLYLAYGAFRQWRRPVADPLARKGKVPGTLLEAALVNLVNPNPYLGWTLILGPAVIAAWRESPERGVAVVAAFYTVMVTMLAVLIVAFGSARVLGARFQRALLLLSVLILAGLGAYQLAVFVRYFSTA